MIAENEDIVTEPTITSIYKSGAPLRFSSILDFAGLGLSLYVIPVNVYVLNHFPLIGEQPVSGYDYRTYRWERKISYAMHWS